MKQHRGSALLLSMILTLCLASQTGFTAAQASPLPLAKLGSDAVGQRTIIDGLTWGPYGDAVRMFNLVPITPENVDQIEQLAAFEESTFGPATFSPDGKLLATTSGEGTVALWDIAKGKVINTLSVECTGWVGGIAFSPDGTLVAAAVGEYCRDGYVPVWEVATGNLRFQLLDDFEHGALSVAFSPDGAMLAAGTGCVFDIPGSATIKVWDTASGTLRRDLSVVSSVLDVAFSPDGTLLASASGDGNIRLWDVGTGTIRTEMRVATVDVFSVAFSPDGTKLASGGSVARLWDVARGRQLFYLYEASVGKVIDVAFSVDGRLLVTGGGSHTLLFWDTATRMKLAVREVGVVGNLVSSVAFNADGTLLATCGQDQMLRLWGVQGQ